jgi:hypothetical protein
MLQQLVVDWFKMSNIDRYIATRRVLFEKTGHFWFDWMPKSQKDMLLKIITEANSKIKIQMISDVISTHCKVKITPFTKVYSPDNFSPLIQLLIRRKDGREYILRTMIGIELLGEFGNPYRGGTEYEFLQLIEMLVDGVRAEI